MVKGSKDDSQRESQEHVRLADGAEATAVFLHYLGNVLNNLLLGAKLMQRKLPAEYQSGLADQTKLIHDLAERIKTLSTFRHSLRPQFYPVDVNQIVRRVAAGTAYVRVSAEENLPSVLASEADISRTIRMLIESASAFLCADSDDVLVETFTTDGRVAVRVTDSGPTVPAESLPTLFDPWQQVRPGASVWALPICKSLVRVTNGTIDVCIADSGLATTVMWPAMK